MTKRNSFVLLFIIKIVLNEYISKSKSGNQLLELQQEYNSFVQQYTKLIDKIEKNKLIIIKNDEKIQQLNEMIDSLTVIAEKNYNLILNPEDNKNSKEKEKLSNLRKSLINEYGDNYNNKNILKNIIQTKENEISKQKRMISDYNNQISNFKNEVTLIEDELRRMYNTINEIVKEEELT
jgi:chromosome segregation ATPase